MSQLRAIWREFAADTALKLGRIFLLFLFFISKRRIIEGMMGGRGKLETKLWKIGELNYDVSWIDVYFTFS